MEELVPWELGQENFDSSQTFSATKQREKTRGSENYSTASEIELKTLVTPY